MYLPEVEDRAYKPGEFARLIGVTVKTLQRWDKEGVLVAYRRPPTAKEAAKAVREGRDPKTAGRRYYTRDHYIRAMNGNQEGGE